MKAPHVSWILTGSLLVAGVAGFGLQARTQSELRAEIAVLRQQANADALRAENALLAAVLAEVEDLRRDDGRLQQLREDAEALQRTLQAAAAGSGASGGAGSATPVATTTAADGKPTPGPVYAPGDVDRVPVLRFQARPQYPFELRRQGVTGEARIEFVVDANGNPRDVVAVAATHPEFAAAAVAAVQKWRYRAGEKDRAPVNVRLSVPVTFSLSTGSGAAPRAADGRVTPPEPPRVIPTEWF